MTDTQDCISEELRTPKVKIKYPYQYDTKKNVARNDESEYNEHRNSKFDQKLCFGRRRQRFNPYNENPAFFRQKRDRNVKYPTKSDQKDNKKSQEVFRYGNFHQYYGYRNEGNSDSRFQCMKQEWFCGKDVLDIGCNAGHFTLTIAKDFLPRSIIGVDIDHMLIKMAKSNVKHYINPADISWDDFPLSLVLSYGPVAQAFDPKCRYSAGNYPFNVQFIEGNYILPSDDLLSCQEPCFDTILCLSLTKWIHLNWGDIGIKRLFHRAYAQLHPGGYFILESQDFKSYAKKKKITEEAFQYYNNIQLYPEMFNEYLLKEVGFETCELIDTPAHSSKGFSRPIYLFIKGHQDEVCTERKPKHIIYSDSDDNYSDVEQLSD